MKFKILLYYQKKISNFKEDDFEDSSSYNSTIGKRNQIIFTRRGIQEIQDSQVMNLQYENLIQRIIPFL